MLELVTVRRKMVVLDEFRIFPGMGFHFSDIVVTLISCLIVDVLIGRDRNNLY